LLADGGSDQDAMAKKVNSAITSANLEEWSGQSPDAWANESHASAVKVAYGALPSSRKADLSGSYSDRARPVVEEQLKKAGIRLANLLNDTLK
jgi:hypothetical protein